MNTLKLLLFTTLSLDYRLLKSLLAGVFLSFLGDVKVVLIFWCILPHYVDFQGSVLEAFFASFLC